MPLYCESELKNILIKIRTNSLRVLDISAPEWRVNDNFILSSTELSQISQAFKQNSSIQEVAMCYNNIATEGASYIADMIGNHKTVKVLDLRWNRINAQGAKLISDGLAKNNSLIELKLDNNLMGDKGVIALSQALSVNQTLKAIDLRFNSITDKGALVLLNNILNTNYFLTSLNLFNNNISPQHLEFIQKYFKRNADLQRFLIKEVANAASHLLNVARILLRPNQLNKIGLPNELKEYILSFIDSKQVLKPEQVEKIIEYAQSKSTLSKLPGLFGFRKYRKKSDFLKATYCDHYHMPITGSYLALFFGTSRSKEKLKDKEVFEKSSEVSLRLPPF